MYFVDEGKGNSIQGVRATVAAFKNVDTRICLCLLNLKE